MRFFSFGFVNFAKLRSKFPIFNNCGAQDNLLGGQFWAMGRLNLLGGQIE